MKLVKKIVPVVLSLTLCASMVAPAFAATFTELQGAIKTGDSVYNDDGGYKIEASKDESGMVNVTLHEDVTYQAKDPVFVDTTNKTVTLNLNGYTIDGGNRYDEDGNQTASGSAALIGTWGATNLTINGGADENDTEKTGILTGGNYSAIFVNGGGSITVNHVELTDNHFLRHDANGGAVHAGGGVDLTMEDVVLKNNSAYIGGAVYVRDGEVNLTDVKFEGNYAQNDGGAFVSECIWGSDSKGTFTMTDCEFADNKAESCGGAISVAGNGDLNLVNTSIHDNIAGEGGGILIQCGGDQSLTLENSEITGNYSTGHGGGGLGIAGGESTTVNVDANSTISGNTADNLGDDIAIFADTKVTMNLGDHEWTVDTIESRETEANEKYVSTNEEKEIAADRYSVTDWLDQEQIENYRKGTFGLKFGYTEPDVSGTTPATGSTGSGEAEVEIDEVDVPLAGLFTRADAIGYLWQQAGEPEWELSDFEDVPEDHQWAVAIGWAQDMGIAVADLEGNFRPDDLVLRSVEDIELSPEGELQEFLNRYAVYAGIELDADELFIELGGEPDDIIMGEDAQVIFDDFFAKLEAALSAAA